MSNDQRDVAVGVEAVTSWTGVPAGATQTAGCGGVPTFWFASNGEHGPFDQLATALRRRGYRVVRLVPTQASVSVRLADRLIYHRTVTIEEFVRGTAGPFADEETLDVQWYESVVLRIPDEAIDRFPAHIADRLRHRRLLCDKLAVARLLESAGVPVAPHLAASTHTDADAIALLGLPLMVKAAISSGSQGVIEAATADQVAQAVADLGVARDHVFFQPFLPGSVLNYDAVVGADLIPLAEAAVRQVRPADSPRRTGLEIVDDPELLAYGRRVCAAIGVVGPVDLDVIRGEDGPMLIDVNPRPWGTMMSLSGAGVNFDAHYLTAVGVETPDGGLAKVGAVVGVFPDVVAYVLTTRGVLAAVRTFVEAAAAIGRRTGFRYLVHTLAMRVIWRLSPAAAAAEARAFGGQ
ncbi:hypothetical protein Back2_00400 [Nocardioides baekrokdamisoli]|uniref:ATP-grasp domain-containing protein n=1 Tax=Nocardioides baekrokdamisoli TaxID=1804624 RepID=A0A3G9IU93_9ACTN|nr:ATP-grasp domain-containing protein [Nocardioides baekrokdamisoli]BBH15753.1 hypothetical protein Back2_00400 [Nocardioides baekrokdamisoli]